MSVKTRFAPSPTGSLHIGGVRTALFSWLFARHHDGEFILRIEDTDRERSTDEAIQIILDGMQWLGLQHDGDVYYQTARFERYQEVIDKLLAEDKAYQCSCSRERLEGLRNEALQKGEKPRYDGHCRGLNLSDTDTVIRFRNPAVGDVVIQDAVQGAVRFDNAELDDLIIARADGTPTYNLTVVVDDMDMEISHVIRGDDHLNNTPRQMNIFHALNAGSPIYAHIPMILGSNGRKLSKRDDAASVLQYRDDGYLPDAILNYLVRLGWSHGDQEVFSRDELVTLFDISDINKSAASINLEKLNWLNQQYLRNTDSADLESAVSALFQAESISITDDGPELIELIDVQKLRVGTLQQIVEHSRYFYADFEEFDKNAAKKHLRPIIFEPMQKLYDRLTALQDWNNEHIKMQIEQVAAEFDIGMGKLGQPLRVALTGTGISPNINDTLRLLGKGKTLKRMEKALDFIEKRASS